MDVSVPVVDGKEIKDYDEDLRNKAREVITKIYKEIVCGENDVGEQSTMLIQAANSNSIQMMQASIDELKEQITRLQEEKHPKKEAMKSFLVEDEKIVMNAKRFTIINSPVRDNLEERVANLELQLAEVKESTSCHMQLMQNNIQEIKSRTIQPHLSNRSC
ncbi:hypothetical protein DNY36_21200 [Salmonella enterica subsp. diarizonae]|nr:hypothetical protein [Salmonella enterica subsp. diarizonae]ECI3628361.1 hypothetical protein [Salmonella enterica subsp. diarizonae]EDT8143961.1 hypothetical protein [Salmonella enterica subsp. diarizonae]MLW03795.1 hypothetical protein [Salmonella enterica]